MTDRPDPERAATALTRRLGIEATELDASDVRWFERELAWVEQARVTIRTTLERHPQPGWQLRGDEEAGRGA